MVCDQTLSSHSIVSDLNSFYCVMLLTAMFMASCYWPPVSLDTPLSKPWSDNITTFGEALLSRVPELPLDMIPATIPIVDRCWCDFSMGFFEPFNSTRWEWNSVEKLRVDLARQVAARNTNLTLSEEGYDVDVNEDEESVPVRSNATLGYSVLSGAMSTLNAVQNKLGFANPNSSVPAASSSTPPIVQLTSPPATKDTVARTLSTLWREYDLRSYGFDMVVDLRWPQSP